MAARWACQVLDTLCEVLHKAARRPNATFCNRLPSRREIWAETNWDQVAIAGRQSAGTIPNVVTWPQGQCRDRPRACPPQVRGCFFCAERRASA